MRTSLGSWSLIFVVSSLVACGGGVTAADDGGSHPDGSTGHDGSTGTDGGTTGTDGGTAGTDGGTTGTDGGTTGTDGGATCADDGVACTVDGIDGSGACAHLPSDLLCAPGGHCDATVGCMYPGSCTPAMCDDSNPCTIDGCGGTGTTGCAHTVDLFAPCDDGMATTSSDHCISMAGMGVCRGSPISCDDMNPCTLDVLSSSGTCTHPPTDQPCTDHDACTNMDHCRTGVCVGTDIACSSAGTECCSATGTCITTAMCIATGP